MRIAETAKGEEGFVLVAALVVLLLLVILGTTSLTNTNVELKIAGNTREMVQELYVAETSWQEGGNWLLNFAKPPQHVNTSGEIENVRNFGDGAAGVLNNDFPAGSEDGFLGGVPYWYKVAYRDDRATQGSGKDYRDFYYDISGNADRAQELAAVVRKVYKVGY
ncbi:PilX N-terminal domain-containing pilus assembly protein [Thiovibrio sp. JS02]